MSSHSLWSLTKWYIGNMAQVSIIQHSNQSYNVGSNWKKGGGGRKKCDSLFYAVFHYDVTIANLCLWKHRQSDIISQKKKSIFVEKIQNGKYNLLYLYFFHLMLFVFCPFEDDLHRQTSKRKTWMHWNSGNF